MQKIQLPTFSISMLRSHCSTVHHYHHHLHQPALHSHPSICDHSLLAYQLQGTESNSSAQLHQLHQLGHVSWAHSAPVLGWARKTKARYTLISPLRFVQERKEKQGQSEAKLSAQNERTPLLSDNYRPQYNRNAANRYKPDPEFLRREREALDNIVNNMSE